MIFKSSLAVLAVAGLTGCAAVDVAEYRAEKPAFDLARYFNGTVDGWGMFQDRSGKVVRRFTVRIDARWDGDTGKLDEHFEYADGEKQNQLKRLAEFHAMHADEAPAMLARLREAVIDNANVFEVLMDAVRVCSLGQISAALYDVGGQYRRNL